MRREDIKSKQAQGGKRPAKTHSNAVSRAERVACITGCTLTLYHTLHA